MDNPNIKDNTGDQVRILFLGISVLIYLVTQIYFNAVCYPDM